MSIITSEKCILCGKDNPFYEVADCLRDSSDHTVVECRSCGHTQISPLPTVEEDRLFYEWNNQAHAVGISTDLEYQRMASLVDTQRRANFIAKHFSPGKLLDVGAGYGFFMELMNRLGYETEGIEISKGKRLSSGIPMVPSIEFLDWIHNIGKFENITMFHVLEHILDPIELCRKLRNYLDGALIIEVPNLDDQMIHICRDYGDFYWQRAHLSYFNYDTLRYTLAKAGYKSIEIIGAQRYGASNKAHWLETGKPQIPPVYITREELDGYAYQINTFNCDTLIAVAR